MKRLLVSSSYSFTLLAFLLLGLTSPAAAQHFEDCLTNNGNNATILVPDTVETRALGSEARLETGDEIAVFTSSGACAGAGVWEEGQALAITVAGADQFTAGFAVGEALSYRVWNQSTDETTEVSARYHSCVVSCQNADDYSYYPDAFYIVAGLEGSSTAPSVDFTSFGVQLEGSEALLEWSTARETNNAGFEVQHQAPAPDNKQGESNTWRAVDFVDGHGTTTEAHHYSYRVKDLEPGTHRFRLKQLGLDGAYEFSTVTEVSIIGTALEHSKAELADGYELGAPYPNPFALQSTIKLTVAREQQVAITLYNQLGQRVAVLHEGPLRSYDTYSFSLEADGLASGVYFLRVAGEHFSETKRAVLL